MSVIPAPYREKMMPAPPWPAIKTSAKKNRDGYALCVPMGQFFPRYFINFWSLDLLPSQNPNGKSASIINDFCPESRMMQYLPLPYISPWLLAVLIILVIWEAVWKAIGLWKSGRNNQLAWFACIFIFNTAGILPIVYLKFYQKKNAGNAKEAQSKKRRL